MALHAHHRPPHGEGHDSRLGDEDQRAVHWFIDGDERATVRSLADAVTTLTVGLRDLVGALDEGATITVDAAWAEAADGGEG